jgi:hypothetical protein
VKRCKSAQNTGGHNGNEEERVSHSVRTMVEAPSLDKAPVLEARAPCRSTRRLKRNGQFTANFANSRATAVTLMRIPADEWRVLIADSLTRLADVEFQRAAWFGKDQHTSPGEQISQLVDAFGFEEFIRSPEINLSGAQEVPAFDLLARLERYGGGRGVRLNPYKVINDPEWVAIRADARLVLSVLFPGASSVRKAFNANRADEFHQSLPCIVCGCKLENFGSDENQPLRGVEFVARGHYGSTVFDPIDGSRIIVNICDKCLAAAMALKKVQIIPLSSHDRGQS